MTVLHQNLVSYERHKIVIIWKDYKISKFQRLMDESNWKKNKKKNIYW